MKKYKLVALSLLLSGIANYSNAQNISINTTGVTPNGSAILDLNTGNTWTTPNGKGFLVPCMDSNDMKAIATPASGLYIYNTSCKVFDYWNGTAWIPLPSSALSVSGPITGLTSVCQGATGVAYSVPAVTAAATYIWTLPVGATIASGTGTNSITVNFTTNSGNVCVTAGNGCGTTSPYCTTVYAGAAPSIVANANPTSICNGSSSTLTASGASSYTWLPTSSLSPSTGSTVTASPTITTTYTVTGTTGTCISTQTVTVNVGTNNYWTQMSPTGGPPSIRDGVECSVWDNTDNEIIVFGGQTSGSTFLNDIWIYSPSSNTWTSPSPSGTPPSVRELAFIVWDNTDKVMLVFGGDLSYSTFYNDLFSYSPSLNKWTTLSPTGGPPPARTQGACAWDATDDKMFIFGGYNFSRLGDLWAYDFGGNTWTSYAPGGGPSPRNGQAGVWDATDKKFLVSGGYDGPFYNDLYAYSPSGNTWTTLATSPSTICDQAALWDPINNTMYMHGGNIGGSGLTILWAYSVANNTWTQLTACGTTPAGRWTHAGIWDTQNNSMYIFGGYDGSLLNDTWQYIP